MQLTCDAFAKALLRPSVFPLCLQPENAALSQVHVFSRMMLCTYESPSLHLRTHGYE